jgi:hypothetical protein
MSFSVFLKHQTKQYHIRIKTTKTPLNTLVFHLKLLIKCKNHIVLTFFQRKIHFGTRFAFSKNENKLERLVFHCVNYLN